MAIDGTHLDLPDGRVWHAVTGRSSGIPLLVIHGIPGTSSRYCERLADLGADRPVIFYDQLGGGRSDRPSDPSLWTVDKFVQEVSAVRAALRLSELHVLGHSWGGMLAVEHALREPDGVRSLTLVSAPLSIPDYVQDIRGLREQLPEDALTVLREHERSGTTSAPAYQQAVNRFHRRHLCRCEPWPAELLESFGDMNGDVFGRLWGPDPFGCAGALATYDRTNDLQALACPVLFIVGGHDLATPARAQAHAARVPGSRVGVLEESSHTPMLEEPARFIDTVQSFLRDVDGV